MQPIRDLLRGLRAAFQAGKGFYAFYSGRHKDAVRHLERSLELDPTSPVADYLDDARRRLNRQLEGMSMGPDAGQRIKDVRCTDDTLSVEFVDGRIVSVPLAWSPRLLHATSNQRANWELAGSGFGIHWPDIDEDLSSEGILRGRTFPELRTNNT